MTCWCAVRHINQCVMKNTWLCWPATCDCLHFNYIKNKIKWLSFNSNISSTLQHLLDSTGVEYFHPCRKSTGQDGFLVPWWARLPKQFRGLPCGLPQSSPKVQAVTDSTLCISLSSWGRGCLLSASAFPHFHRKPLQIQKFTGVLEKENWANDFLEQGNKNASLTSASYVVLLAFFSSSSAWSPSYLLSAGCHK